MPFAGEVLCASQAATWHKAYLQARRGGAASGKNRHNVVGDKIGVGDRIAFDSGE
jgi:hypothetical protein